MSSRPRFVQLVSVPGIAWNFETTDRTVGQPPRLCALDENGGVWMFNRDRGEFELNYSPDCQGKKEVKE